MALTGGAALVTILFWALSTRDSGSVCVCMWICICAHPDLTFHTCSV